MDCNLRLALVACDFHPARTPCHAVGFSLSIFSACAISAFSVALFVVILSSWFGLVWLDVDLGLAIVAWIVFAKKQMPELVCVIRILFPDVRDRNCPSRKPQLSGRDFNLFWQV